MHLTETRIALLLGIGALAFVLGRVAVRALGNALLGGTLFGGDIL